MDTGRVMVLRINDLLLYMNTEKFTLRFSTRMTNSRPFDSIDVWSYTGDNRWSVLIDSFQSRADPGLYIGFAGVCVNRTP